ncbi:hypothetical protein dsat_2585 [Alkalidesulfovibrio alkalitolerans DSM 16529]|uniref:SPOR domain-containing protein n=1 Tax=Alkalidesulfovibrio alkalitolerans DSM 16529 TaxID=1121439 RepID=S7TDN6_9BACT|nr:hypothetical protein [Alkalidesulfovibrio alkalitolerans]EPR34766.1 hypothetical protein dsat_2585 [Alkalidesulfovibrio alkalitolerans DSM 16529]
MTTCRLLALACCLFACLWHGPVSAQGDPLADLPQSAAVTGVGMAFVGPHPKNGPPPERAARRKAIRLARLDALEQAVLAHMGPGPTRDAFYRVRPRLNHMADAYLEAVRQTGEEMNALDALQVSIAASVRLRDMMRDALALDERGRPPYPPRNGEPLTVTHEGLFSPDRSREVMDCLASVLPDAGQAVFLRHAGSTATYRLDYVGTPDEFAQDLKLNAVQRQCGNFALIRGEGSVLRIGPASGD